MTSALLALALALAAPAVPTVVEPEHREELVVLPPEQQDLDKARGLFDAGKKAALDNRWDQAIRFFAEAYRHSGSPGQLYSMGRGHRERYLYEGRDPVQLRLALLRFRQYLERSPDGRNREQAQRFIVELSPYVEVLEGFDEPPPITRLMVHSPVDAARVSIDDAPEEPTPLSRDVQPGEHRVRVRAEGYFDAQRTVAVPEGSTVPIEVGLQAQPATVTLSGPAGAEVYLDGESIGTLPLSPITVEAGEHRVAVAHEGRAPWERPLSLQRGEARDVDAALVPTTQRKIAWVGLGLGSADLAAAVVLTGVSLASQAKARGIEDEREAQGITVARREEALAAWERRDATRTAAIVTGVTGAAVLGTALVLYLTDDPRAKDRGLARVVPGRGLTVRF